jgi:hypothetical protein
LYLLDPVPITLLAVKEGLEAQGDNIVLEAGTPLSWVWGWIKLLY